MYVGDNCIPMIMRRSYFFEFFVCGRIREVVGEGAGDVGESVYKGQP